MRRMFLSQVRRVKLLQCIFVSCLIAGAFSTVSLAEDIKGPLLRAAFSGTSNEPGWVFKLDTAAGYRFNRHFEISGGVPLYFVHASDSIATEGIASKNGIGDAYINMKLLISRPAFYFSSSVKGAAPTGDEANGFSTGRATFDWTNYVEADIGRWTPFGSLGIANTVSDTHFFNRPFTSLGIVGHFEGGIYFRPSDKIAIGGSGYAITPTGQQKIYSKLMKRSSATPTPVMPGNSGGGNHRGRIFENTSYTSGDSSIARDHGASAWIDIYPASTISLEAGFSHSTSYDYNSLFFSLQFDFGKFLSKRRR